MIFVYVVGTVDILSSRKISYKHDKDYISIEIRHNIIINTYPLYSIVQDRT